jgi:hypothetical protein
MPLRRKKAGQDGVNHLLPRTKTVPDTPAPPRKKQTTEKRGRYAELRSFSVVFRTFRGFNPI